MCPNGRHCEFGLNFVYDIHNYLAWSVQKIDVEYNRIYPIYLISKTVVYSNELSVNVKILHFPFFRCSFFVVVPIKTSF